MIVKVHEHTIEIVKTPVNELEVNVTKMQFVFDETIPTNYVKKAFFTNGDVSKVIELVNDECNIPVEVLHKKGQVRLGVIAYEVENDTLIERYNPSPVYFQVWEGSLIEADNTEPITPTDKEQMEALITEVQTQMDNLDIDAEKVEHTTTITITRKDGTSYDVEVLDGEQGPQGEPGVPGAVKFIIVNTLPTENIDTSAIYLVPSDDPSSQDLYLEYMYINNNWELLGQKQIAVDLTDYVKNTDYANGTTGGVIKTSSNVGTSMSNGVLIAQTLNNTDYGNASNALFVSKGTLDNVLTAQIGSIADAIDLISGEVI